MPIFLDRHDLKGLSAADIAEAHRKDLEVQGQYGVRFLTYWFDDTRGTASASSTRPTSRPPCASTTRPMGRSPAT